MRRSVDPASKTGHHDNPAMAQRGREIPAETPAICRGVARTDHRHHWPIQQLGAAEHGQDRRCIVNDGKGARISGLAPANEVRADAVNGSEFGLGFGSGGGSDCLGALAAAGELRHRLERRTGRAEAAQHRIEADRADRLGAAQAQPVEALLRIEFACGQSLPQLFLKEIRLSVPASRRRILAWCRKMINRAIPAITKPVEPPTTSAASRPLTPAAAIAASEE
jgi:hypothetical protein